MPYFVVYKERLPSTVDVVSKATITRGFQDALRQSLRQGSEVHWVGPEPRITRTGGILAPVAIRVAWVMEVPTPADPSVSALSLARNLAHSMDGIIEPAHEEVTPLGRETVPSKWLDATVTEWTEAANGPISWWQGGQAARTLTMDGPLVASTERPENPVGPDGTDTRPGGGGAQPGMFDGLASSIKFVAIAGIIAAGIYGIVQIAPAINLGAVEWSSRRSAKRASSEAEKQLAAAPRSNPRRRRRGH